MELYDKHFRCIEVNPGSFTKEKGISDQINNINKKKLKTKKFKIKRKMSLVFFRYHGETAMIHS